MEIKKKIEKYIKQWEKKGYQNGIPDEAPFELENKGLVPSYRLICISIMRNPNNLEKLGFNREKCKIYQEIKRVEIDSRVYNGKQYKIKYD